MKTNSIRFFSENIPFIIRHKKLLRAWIVSTIETENWIPGNINVVFCTDKYLHELNFQFLKHDTLTDIVTFDYNRNDEISGDLFISIDRVRENATILGRKVQEELHRVIIHGVLHLCGYKDKDEVNKKKMSSLEDKYLSQRPHGVGFLE